MADEVFFSIVEIAHADERRVLGQHRWREAAYRRELGGLGAKQRRERHAVHVAAWSACRRVHVAVSVDPQKPERLARRSRVRGRRGDGSGPETVIAAEHQGKGTFFERRTSGLIDAIADLCDLSDEFFLGIAVLSRFRDRRWQVAAIDDDASQRRYLLAKPGDAER